MCDYICTICNNGVIKGIQGYDDVRKLRDLFVDHLYKCHNIDMPNNTNKENILIKQFFLLSKCESYQYALGGLDGNNRVFDPQLLVAFE